MRPRHIQRLLELALGHRQQPGILAIQVAQTGQVRELGGGPLAGDAEGRLRILMLGCLGDKVHLMLAQEGLPVLDPALRRRIARRLLRGEVVNRLEAREDPEEIEKTMPDLAGPGGGDDFGVMD